jgi:hypothetical protein
MLPYLRGVTTQVPVSDAPQHLRICGLGRRTRQSERKRIRIERRHNATGHSYAFVRYDLKLVIPVTEPHYFGLEVDSEEIRAVSTCVSIRVGRSTQYEKRWQYQQQWWGCMRRRESAGTYR